MLGLIAGVRLALAMPNVLLIVADDVGVDKVGAYAQDYAGYSDDAAYLPATPNIDLLATGGLRFAQAWAAPVCSPTRAGILTGRYPFRTEVGAPVPRGPALSVDELTLPEALVALDEPYATGLFGKWHLGVEGAAGTTDWDLHGEDEEYREVQDTANPLRHGYGAFSGTLGGVLDDYNYWVRVEATEPGFSTIHEEFSYATFVTGADAADWIATQSEPWFATVAFHAAHTDGSRHSYDQDDADPSCHAVSCVTDGSCADMEKAVMQALVECLDTEVGTLLSGMEEDPLRDTLIVFVGDNGSESWVQEGDFAELGTRPAGGKSTAYESGIRVPLLVASGRNWAEAAACPTCPLTTDEIVAPGRVVGTPVLTLDLYATILALAGGQSTVEDSVSFAACLTDPSPACATTRNRVLYTERFDWRGDGAGADTTVLEEGTAALRRGRHKLVVTWDAEASCYTRELYDLRADPFELTELAASRPTLLTSLEAALAQIAPTWLADRDPC